MAKCMFLANQNLHFLRFEQIWLMLTVSPTSILPFPNKSDYNFWDSRRTTTAFFFLFENILLYCCVDFSFDDACNDFPFCLFTETYLLRLQKDDKRFRWIRGGLREELFRPRPNIFLVPISQCGPGCRWKSALYIMRLSYRHGFTFGEAIPNASSSSCDAVQPMRISIRTEIEN